jgi:hypothetical protein
VPTRGDAESAVRPSGSRAKTPEAVVAMCVRAVTEGRAVVETSAFVKGVGGVADGAGVFRRITTSMAARSKG